jgi:hypothetical protein
VTSPVSRTTPCRLTRTVNLAPGSAEGLRLVVGHFPGGSWDLVVKANGNEIARHTIDAKTAPDGWLKLDIDLLPYAGQNTRLDLIHQSNGSRLEIGYWAAIEIIPPLSPQR